MKDALKTTFKIIAWILFPIITGLYYIWPSKIFKDKMSKPLRIFCWIIYAVLAFPYVVTKIFILCFVIVLIGGGYDEETPTIIESYTPAPYRTSEDFYKLTGVKFPELEIVDSLFYDEGGLRSNYWNEYRFVAKDGLRKSFYKRIKRACKTDSTHWNYSEDGIYNYWIYPDSTPVDRSRGMCDRMVECPPDGEKVVDWEGSFISVNIQNDTIVLREGWVR